MAQISKMDLINLRKKGFFTDAQGTITGNNIGLPAGLLSQLSSDIVENVLAKRTAEEALGKMEKLVDWADVEYNLPFVEKTGTTTPYGDFNQGITSGLNTSFEKHGHYLFTAKYQYGDREAEQYARAKMNYAQIALSGATEALAVELNRTAFDGYITNTGGDYLCYGLLNNPLIGNYVNANKTFNAMTWVEVMTFFGTAVKALAAQTGNNINGQSNIRVVISASAYADLETKYTDLGVPVLETIQTRYKGMKFVPAIEFDLAYSGTGNVIYFIGESQVGGLPDTTKLGYSEIARMGNVVMGDNSYSQAISAGTVGAVVYKPFMIKRYYGV